MPPPIPKARAATDDHSPAPHPWRRFFARWIDYGLAGLILGAVGGFLLAFTAGVLGLEWPLLLRTQINIELAFFVFGGLLVTLLWVPVEAWLLKVMGTTPGKWLLRVKLEAGHADADHRAQRLVPQHLPYRELLTRSARVWARGLGCGLPLVSTITAIVAWVRLRRDGETTWDRESGFVVSCPPLGAIRTVAGSLLAIFILFIIGIEIPKQNPESTPSDNYFDKYDPIEQRASPGLEPEWTTVDNAEYGFRLSYPANWSLYTGPKLALIDMAVVISTRFVTCHIAVVSQPASTTQSQESLDQGLLASPMSAENWREIICSVRDPVCSQFKLRAFGFSTVGGHPAYQALSEFYTHQTQLPDKRMLQDLYRVSTTLATYTPGFA